MAGSRFVVFLVRGALLGAVLALLLWTRLFTRVPALYVMTGGSMEPAVSPGEYYTASGPLRQVERGALVLFRFVDGDDIFHVLRRVAALPGDTVAMVQGRLLVNGEEAPWPFRVLVPAASRSVLALTGDLYDWGPVLVPSDSVFLLSDTRDMIGWPDSRFIGPVPFEALEARAGRILWSPDRRRLLRRLRRRCVILYRLL